MRLSSRMSVWASILASTTAAGLLVVGGCALDKPENRPKQVFNRIGGHGGQIIEPRRCLIRVAILDRPFRDPAINEALWRVVDEQVISPAEHKALEANGLRVGRIIGELPREVETILKEEHPGTPKVVPADMLIEDGDPKTLINVGPRVEQVSLLVNRDDRVTGKDYHDVTGYLRLTPRHHGAHAVSLRVIPEIHHGPLQRTFPTMPNAAGLAPQELTIRDAQQEEPIRELAIDLLLEEGQVAVIGCRPDNLRSLGTFLFSQPGAENEERRQRLILIWASRNLPGVVAEAPKGGDRPKLFRRLMGASDEPTPSPALPDPAPASIPAAPVPTASTKPGAAPARPAATPAKSPATAPARLRTRPQTAAAPPADASSVPSAARRESQAIVSRDQQSSPWRPTKARFPRIPRRATATAPRTPHRCGASALRGERSE